MSLKNSTSKLPVTQSTAIMLLILSPVCLLIIFTSKNINYDINLFIMMASSATLDAVAMACYLLALRNGPLAKVVPLLCFVPVFQVILLFIFYSTVPSLLGSIAIIVAILSIFYGEGASLKSVCSDKAVINMLCVALLWSLSSIIHQNGAHQIGALSWTAHICLFMFLYYSPFLIKIRSSSVSISDFFCLMIPAMAHLLTLLSFYQAASMGHIAFVSSLRRFSTVFSVFIGWYKYNEKITNRVCVSIFGLIVSALTITLFG